MEGIVALRCWGLIGKYRKLTSFSKPPRDSSWNLVPWSWDQGAILTGLS
jgi:hypothetical protein